MISTQMTCRAIITPRMVQVMAVLSGMCAQGNHRYHDFIPSSTRVSLLLFWHAPLGVCSAIRRCQPPQRTVLGQVDCFIQCQAVGSDHTRDNVQPRYADMICPSGLFQLSDQWGSH